MLIDFDLPERLIATHPVEPRDRCKMLVYHRASQTIHHTTFHALPIFLTDHDFLVLNQARVNPSRIFWTDEKNKKQEIVFLKHLGNEKKTSTWEAIVSGKKLKPHQPYIIAKGFHFELMEDRTSTLTKIKINCTKAELEKFLRTKGELPLPPYIGKRRKDLGENSYIAQDEKDYQTVFTKTGGAVAAPTAGLHFTKQTFQDLKDKEIGWDFLNLEVGWGTFEPLNEKHFQENKLHTEFCEISPKLATKILSEKDSGKNIVAVGTTTVRTLETWAQEGFSKQGLKKETSIFIHSDYEFLAVDKMITNFHLPQSSLLLLVASFLGKDGNKKILEIYKEAIDNNYRFYSYGDCMLIV